MKKMILFLSLALIFTTASDACRFNVRDVGFVDLNSDPYYFYIYVNDEIDETRLRALKQISFAAFLDTNIQPKIINVDHAEELSAVEYLDRDSDLRYPTAVLVSPTGSSLPVAFDFEKKDFNQAVWDTLEMITQSNLRDQLTRQLIQHYGIVLVVEGEDQEENKRVQQIVQNAIETIQSRMVTLPKAIDHPPIIQTIKQEQFSEEKILLWSLGIEKSDHPYTAVFYGRGRLMGSVLYDKQITQSQLENYLNIIGLNCECGLDRSWMQGYMYPLQWKEEYQKMAYQQLQFDPENPMVKIEISQILSKSPSQMRSDASSIDSLLMGYSEGMIVETELSEQMEDIDQNRNLGDNILDVTAEGNFVMSVDNQSDQMSPLAPTIMVSLILFFIILLAGGWIVIRNNRRTS